MAVADGTMRGRLAAALGAVAATRVLYGALRTRPPGGAARWERKNYAGRVVDLYGGPASAAGAAFASVAAPGLSARTRSAAALAVLAAGGGGAYDDMAGADDSRRGFRAHLSALRQGELTSGAVKLLGIGAAGLAAGVLLKERPVDKILAGVVIAGSAHAVNLLDVRPGRAAGAVLAAGAPGLLRRGPAGILSAAPMGAAAAVLADDLGERTMLGDAGAHALGAGLGLAIVAGNGRTGLAAHAVALVAAAAAGDRAGCSD
jgi:UDP-N-acetylmuramyl pentapeptide phosphotransferase/UDP-N-acetylglucosamine-1-phosphate transferase